MFEILKNTLLLRVLNLSTSFIIRVFASVATTYAMGHTYALFHCIHILKSIVVDDRTFRFFDQTIYEMKIPGECIVQ